ncbi:MAG: hypothetical protein AB7H80_15550 [Candidatus Kapaibacterium sp.]
MKNVLKNIAFVLCCGLVIAACDLSPTDFDDPVASTESFPLKEVSVKDVHLFVGSRDFTGDYCLALDSSSTTGVPIPGFDTLHTFTGNVQKVNDKWYLSLSLHVDFPNEGVFQIIFFDNPQPRGFTLQFDSIELTSDPIQGVYHSGTCPTGSAQLKVAVLKTRPTPPYIEGWKDFQDIHATLELNLAVEEVSGDHVQVTGDFQMFSTLKIKDDRGGGGGYEEEEVAYIVSANLEME